MIKRHIVRSMVLKEISTVDNPAQIGATMKIMKRRDDALGTALRKRYMDSTASIDFKSILEQAEKNRQLWAARDKLWPLFDALNDSISSTVTDTSLNEAARKEKIGNNVAAFLAAVQEQLPEVEEELTKVFLKHAGSSGASPTNGENNVDDKTRADTLQKSLDAEIAKALRLENITKMSADEKAHFDGLTGDAADQYLAKSASERVTIATLAKAGDETVIVEGQTLRKSVVGETMFNIMKAQAVRIEKAESDAKTDRENALLVTLTKKAEDEFGNLPGDSKAKAQLLKAVSNLPAEHQATLDAMLKAGNTAMTGAFEHSGTSTVKKNADGTVDDPQAEFSAKVDEIVAAEKVTKSVALIKAANKFPDLAARAREAA